MSDRGIWAAALASLPGAGSRRLDRLIAGREPSEVWAAVQQGRIPVDCGDESLRRSWRHHAATVDLDQMTRVLRALDVWVSTPVDASHPSRLAGDIDPAPILFRQGRVLDSSQPRVAIVGTRRCSPTGRAFSAELGAGLTGEGVSVVSGLALGIDGAAHRGALSTHGAPPIGVVGSGIDVVYPRGNADLWSAMAGSGTLLTEAPLGADPDAWRFPARNRLLAALADVVVVIESKIAGGSMHTVDQAVRRGITVMAVPGSVRNQAAAGTNRLISEGCPPVCSVDDVLMALGLATEGRARSGESEGSGATTPAPLTEIQRLVLDAVDDEPVTLDRLVVRVRATPVDVLVAADELVTLGWLARDGGRLIRGGP